MAEQTTQWFEVAQGAPPGTAEAFTALTTLILTQPNVTSAVFNTSGELPDEHLAAAQREAAARTSPEHDLLSLIDRILYEQFDLETEFGDRIDGDMRRWLARRRETERPSERARRLKRLEFFLSALATSSQVVS